MGHKFERDNGGKRAHEYTRDLEPFYAHAHSDLRRFSFSHKNKNRQVYQIVLGSNLRGCGSDSRNVLFSSHPVYANSVNLTDP